MPAIGELTLSLMTNDKERAVDRPGAELPGSTEAPGSARSLASAGTQRRAVRWDIVRDESATETHKGVRNHRGQG